MDEYTEQVDRFIRRGVQPWLARMLAAEMLDYVATDDSDTVIVNGVSHTVRVYVSRETVTL